MDVEVGFMELLKLGGKLVSHKYIQYRLGTNETEVINTQSGKVKGLKRKTLYGDGNSFYYAFEGIPYAKPPLGELRFRAPQPVVPWKDIKDCTTYGPKPLQMHFVYKMVEGSEDCLQLNVYAKTLKSEKPLPVMVWIYGGGFQIGEATRDIYSPEYFMQEEVVLVVINYRLGILGFLSLQDPDLQIPGNAGLKDQLMALQWIKANIANFNGDANNITLFGESAGGASTHFLMICEQARGLFHKAIIQSGCVLCPWAYTPQQDWCYKVATMLGYKGSDNEKQIFAFLSKVDGKKLVGHDNNLLSLLDRQNDVIVCFGPVVEPYVSDSCIISRPYKEMLKDAWSNKIPILIGGTSFEGLFSHTQTRKYPFLLNDLGDCSTALPLEIRMNPNKSNQLKEMGLKLKQTFFGDKEPSTKETFFEYLDLITYKIFWHSLHRTVRARLTYAPNAPTYLYRFDFDSPYFNHYRYIKCGSSVRGVSHADDLSYLFYNISAVKLPLNSPEYKTIQRMIGMWTSFAKNSNPNGQHMDSTVWQPVNSVENLDTNPPKCLNISEKLEFIPFPQYNKLTVWDNFYTKDELI